MRPDESRRIFAERGWKTIAALQLRNPMHRSHEYLAKIALEIIDGVFIHQLVGNLKPGDIPADVRVKCIDALVEGYFLKESVLQGGYPLDMRYAGPREGLLHGLFRQNFGCTHMIIGRDHAGVGNYYGPFDAQNICGDAEDPGGAALQDAAHRLDLLVLQVRRHDLHAHLPPRQGRPPVPLRHRPAQGPQRRRRGGRRVLAARSSRSCASTTRTDERSRSSCTARPPAKPRNNEKGGPALRRPPFTFKNRGRREAFPIFTIVRSLSTASQLFLLRHSGIFSRNPEFSSLGCRIRRHDTPASERRIRSLPLQNEWGACMAGPPFVFLVQLYKSVVSG